MHALNVVRVDGNWSLSGFWACESTVVGVNCTGQLSVDLGVTNLINLPIPKSRHYSHNLSLMW